MDRTALVRLRWRLRGAWMWKTFVVLTLVDGLLGHLWPPAGDSESAVAAWILALVLSLVAIVALAWPLTALIRALRRDLPKVIARDYAGTISVIGVSVVLVAVGLVHHPRLLQDHRALEDATARAEAYIGDHAPARFRENLHALDTYQLQPPEIYRTCAHNRQATQTYCVIVNRAKPFGSSVKFAGDEPNALLSEGTS
jgi:hypothetical protein